MFVLFRSTKGHSCICTISYKQTAFLYLLFCTIKGHSCIYTISHNQRTFFYLYYFVQLKGILVYTLFRTTKGHSCICTISHNERAFLYLLFRTTKDDVLVSVLFRTTKGFSCIRTISYSHSCISTISYNQRAFLYLYCFVQPKGILECANCYNQRFPYILIQVFTFWQQPFLHLDILINNFLYSNRRGTRQHMGLRLHVCQMLLHMIICLSRWYISTTIDCTVEWALDLVQLDSIQLMVPLQFSYLWNKSFRQIVWTFVVRDT